MSTNNKKLRPSPVLDELIDRLDLMDDGTENFQVGRYNDVKYLSGKVKDVDGKIKELIVTEYPDARTQSGLLVRMYDDHGELIKEYIKGARGLQHWLARRDRADW